MANENEITIKSLLGQVKTTFEIATEASTLRQLARNLKETRAKEDEALQAGAKAAIYFLANDVEDEIRQAERELAEITERCSQLQHDLDNLGSEPDAATREMRLQASLTEIQEEEAAKLREFEQAGGEAHLRRLNSSERQLSGIAKLRRLRSLYHHITRIKWDPEAEEDNTVGTVIDNKENVIKQFRFGPIRNAAGELDNVAIANKVWATIG